MVYSLLYDMLQHKLRSFLAVSCIAFGTFAVALLLALGSGFQSASMKNMMDITDGSFFVWSDKTSISYHGYPKGQPIYFAIDVINNLRHVLPSIKLISPMLETETVASFNGKDQKFTVTGATPDFATLRKIKLESGGRFFNASDVASNAHVLVLGNKLKTKLFREKPALNKTMLLNTIPFTVIGTIQKPLSGGHDDYDDAAIIPHNVYLALFPTKYIQVFFVMPYPEVDASQFEQTLRSYFANKYHFDKNDKTAIQTFNTNKVFQFMRWFFIAIQIFLGFCGSMTLAVGSIGVANIMFVIVTERTREIGVRKAIGATNLDILLQLLSEALVLVAVGGGIGIIFSYLVTIILHQFHLPDWLGNPVISNASLVATVFILALVGLIAGFFPARRAALMDPVEALTE